MSDYSINLNRLRQTCLTGFFCSTAFPSPVVQDCSSRTECHLLRLPDAPLRKIIALLHRPYPPRPSQDLLSIGYCCRKLHDLSRPELFKHVAIELQANVRSSARLEFLSTLPAGTIQSLIIDGEYVSAHGIAFKLNSVDKLLKSPAIAPGLTLKLANLERSILYHLSPSLAYLAPSRLVMFQLNHRRLGTRFQKTLQNWVPGLLSLAIDSRYHCPSDDEPESTAALTSDAIARLDVPSLSLDCRRCRFRTIVGSVVAFPSRALAIAPTEVTGLLTYLTDYPDAGHNLERLSLINDCTTEGFFDLGHEALSIWTEHVLAVLRKLPKLKALTINLSFMTLRLADAAPGLELLDIRLQFPRRADFQKLVDVVGILKQRKLKYIRIGFPWHQVLQTAQNAIEQRFTAAERHSFWSVGSGTTYDWGEPSGSRLSSFLIHVSLDDQHTSDNSLLAWHEALEARLAANEAALRNTLFGTCDQLASGGKLYVAFDSPARWRHGQSVVGNHSLPKWNWLLKQHPSRLYSIVNAPLDPQAPNFPFNRMPPYDGHRQTQLDEFHRDDVPGDMGLRSLFGDVV